MYICVKVYSVLGENKEQRQENGERAGSCMHVNLFYSFSQAETHCSGEEGRSFQYAISLSTAATMTKLGQRGTNFLQTVYGLPKSRLHVASIGNLFGWFRSRPSVPVQIGKAVIALLTFPFVGIRQQFSQLTQRLNLGRKNKGKRSMGKRENVDEWTKLKEEKSGPTALRTNEWLNDNGLENYFFRANAAQEQSVPTTFCLALPRRISAPPRPLWGNADWLSPYVIPTRLCPCHRSLLPLTFPF